MGFKLQNIRNFTVNNSTKHLAAKFPKSSQNTRHIKYLRPKNIRINSKYLSAATHEKVALLRLQNAFVRVNKVSNLVRQLESKRLQPRRLRAMHHNGLRRIIQRSLE